MYISDLMYKLQKFSLEHEKHWLPSSRLFSFLETGAFSTGLFLDRRAAVSFHETTSKAPSLHLGTVQRGLCPRGLITSEESQANNRKQGIIQSWE